MKCGVCGKKLEGTYDISKISVWFALAFCLLGMISVFWSGIFGVDYLVVIIIILIGLWRGNP